MKTAEKGLREFMQNKPLTVKITEIDQPDVCYGQFGLYSNMQSLPVTKNA